LEARDRNFTDSDTARALRSDLPVNQQFHARVAMTFSIVTPSALLAGVVQLLQNRNGFHFSGLQICVASILGIVLAITFFMHRLVPMMIDRADLRAGFRDASAHRIVRHACPSVAVRDLQGGRWTKDRCGGDQQWRTRLSGRGWTDRRRSG